jgi:hypothetical protein
MGAAGGIEIVGVTNDAMRNCRSPSDRKETHLGGLECAKDLLKLTHSHHPLLTAQPLHASHASRVRHPLA